MDTIKHAVEKTVYLKNDRRLTITYKTNVPVVGSYVQVDTDMASVYVRLIHPYKDQGGFMQPYYLNANITMLESPPVDFLGVLGENYNYVRSTLLEPAMAQLRPKFPMQEDEAYHIPNLWAELTDPDMFEVAVYRRRLLSQPKTGKAKKPASTFGSGKLKGVFKTPLSAAIL